MRLSAEGEFQLAIVTGEVFLSLADFLSISLLSKCPFCDLAMPKSYFVGQTANGGGLS
jgi:hypothetical protein